MTTGTPRFIDYLEAFNRKERFFVAAHATGSGFPDKAALRLSETFREALGKAVGVTIPEDALGFMDYHIDWIHAAAALTRANAGWPSKATAQPIERRAHRDRVSTGNQEDIDLVVAFERDGVTEVVLVEAKAETGWTNSQLNSKAPRLNAIFGPDGDAVQGVHPRFCLWSPKDTLGLTYVGWPSWCLAAGKHYWMELKAPAGRRAVYGSTASGSPSKERAFWHVTRGEAALLEEA